MGYRIEKISEKPENLFPVFAAAFGRRLFSFVLKSL
jgi:hypothetical protein